MEPDGPRQDRPDRDVRAADRVRDPLRALDGLHGVPLSRIREEHVHGLKTREAVEHGIAAIGRVVVAAALIMGTVFAAFILTPDRISKEFGLLLAVAILADALVVKMTLVPAFFTLLGEKTWYIPRWLDRMLPNITIEPPHDGEPVAVSEPGPREASPSET